LVLEANPDLNPLEVREILRLTAERKETLSSADGEGVEDGPWATEPDLDPYWNRHFGWGMVDAHEAVKSALANTDTENLNVDLQAYITSPESGWPAGSDTMTFSGISWARTGSVETVEYSLDGKSWKESQYEIGSNVSIYTNWVITLNPEELSFTGDHTILVRAVGENGTYSVADHLEFNAYGESSEMKSNRMLAILVVIGTLILAVVGITAFRKNLFSS
jgi:hypothetical protein